MHVFNVFSNCAQEHTVHYTETKSNDKKIKMTFNARLLKDNLNGDHLSSSGVQENTYTEGQDKCMNQNWKSKYQLDNYMIAH